MSTSNYIRRVTVAMLRDYIITHRVDQGDSILLHPMDFDHLIQEIKNGPEGIPDLPLKVLKVIITPDRNDEVPVGRIQIVKNEAF